ncbi:MAG: LemA family protein, partial [Phenylobacterium sp.]
MLAGCGFNTIPTKEEAAKAKWADVQSQYQRRADLIPNLVATVKGYAAQERSVLVEVTEARASATQVKVDASTITDPAKF